MEVSEQLLPLVHATNLFFTQRPLSLLEAQPSRNKRDDELQLVMSAEI